MNNNVNILFVCNQNKYRSKTAEVIFKNEFNTRSAGLFNGKILSVGDLKWANIIFVMEEFQREEIAKKFPKEYLSKKIINLKIPDTFSYMDKKLVDLLQNKIRELL